MITEALEGKAAFVTGGAGGIGKASARWLLRDGCSVTLMGRTESSLQDAATELSAEAPDGAIVAGEHVRALAVRLGDRSLDAAAAFVTPRYFEALGTTPVDGRLLGPGDGGPVAGPEAD